MEETAPRQNLISSRVYKYNFKSSIFLIIISGSPMSDGVTS